MEDGVSPGVARHSTERVRTGRVSGTPDSHLSGAAPVSVDLQGGTELCGSTPAAGNTEGLQRALHGL